MEKLKVFAPTTKVKEKAIPFASRPESLRNIRIGLVDNTKYHSDKLLLKIAAFLEKDYGAKSHIIRKKQKASVPVHEAILNEYKANCDLIIAGIGD